MNPPWNIERHVDGVDALHSLGVPDVVERTVRWCVPERSALVLGSAQPDDDVDRSRAAQEGVDVVRRRSGGGAVLVEPGDVVWVDVLIPRGDPLWQEDVGKAFWWLGHVWVDALRSLAVDGAAGAEVHEGALITTPWSRKVCFAGLGPGEVVVPSIDRGPERGPRKVVGISQRRTRHGAMFQCAVLLQFRGQRIAGLLQLEHEERGALRAALDDAVATIGNVQEQAIEQAFMGALTP